MDQQSAQRHYGTLQIRLMANRPEPRRQAAQTALQAVRFKLVYATARQLEANDMKPERGVQK